MMIVILNTLQHVGYRNTDILLLLILLNFNNKIIKTVMKGGKILDQGSSTLGPQESFVQPGKAISQNTMRYEYLSLKHYILHDYSQFSVVNMSNFSLKTDFSECSYLSM